MKTAQILNGCVIQLPIIGEITALDPKGQNLTVKTRSGNEFLVNIRATTWWDAVKNLDQIDRKRPRLGELPEPRWDNLLIGDMVAVEGVYSRNGNGESYDALTIHELISSRGYYQFEHTFWWISQITCMANRWLDNLFGNNQDYTINDFSALYRTSLNIQGMPVQQEEEKQEMATLSRLIYGLSSAYLMSGDKRFLMGAREGVAYQREAFRSISADGRYCFWLHCRMRDRNGRFDVLPSLFADDAGTMPLYEQIYALAGLAQYHRITSDWEVLYDIKRTISAFNTFWADKQDGFFSHIDPVEFSADSSALGPNRSQKNWNSVGDHLPAYLVNVLLAIDPLPAVGTGPDAQGFQNELDAFRKTCLTILNTVAKLIAKHFPQPPNPYVCERFDQKWQPNYSWGWQQNRAICGHNFKIAWNLTRVANYYRLCNRQAEADKLFQVALHLGQEMAKLGVDQIRSGVYDAVERQPANGMPVQFAWLNTKDFWQQEQGILASLILFGHCAMNLSEGVCGQQARDFLRLSRELEAFWNLYFLDRDRNGVFFRVSDNGTPVISSTYGDKGGHAVAGYHSFELCYLTHVYQRTYLPRAQRQHSGFVLHFHPSPDSRLRSLNVLPDFLGPDTVEIVEVTIDGVARAQSPNDFQVKLNDADMGCRILVRFQQTEKQHQKLLKAAIEDTRHF